MAEKYLFISGIFALSFLIDVFLYRKIKKKQLSEQEQTTISRYFFVYVSVFVPLVGYLFFAGEKEASLECRSETMMCELSYSTPFSYPEKRLARTFDISKIRRADVRKSTFHTYTVVLYGDGKEISLPMEYTESILANHASGSFNRFLSQKGPRYQIWYHTFGIPALLFLPLCMIIFFCERMFIRLTTDLLIEKRKYQDDPEQDRKWEEEARETFREEGCSEEEIDKLINEIYEEDKLYENQKASEGADVDGPIKGRTESRGNSSSGSNIPDDVIQRSGRE